MRVVDLAERPAGTRGVGHRGQRIARRLEHQALPEIGLPDGGGPHEAGAVAAIAARELHGDLVDGIEMARARRRAHQKRAIPRPQYRARWRHVAAALQDRRDSGGRDLAFEGARPDRGQHRLEGVVRKRRRPTDVGDLRLGLGDPELTDQIGGVLEYAPLGEPPPHSLVV